MSMVGVFKGGEVLSFVFLFLGLSLGVLIVRLVRFVGFEVGFFLG